MPVLYRKYRPKTFSEVVGQEAIVKTLKNALVKQSTAHAYLFTGSRGVGKTTVARVLARSLNCLNSKDGEACLKCSICQAFESGSFLDMVEIDAASNTGVDNVRELIENVKFQPSMGKFKVYIIDETHMLSKAAFNALLKTLEEPPNHVVFVLATTEANKVPVTIVSRTQRFDFGRISEPLILEHLGLVAKKEGIKIPKEVLALVSKSSSGSLRDSLSLLGKVSSIPGLTFLEAQNLLGVTDLEYSKKLFRLILSGDLASIAEFFSSFLEQEVDVLNFNKDFLEFLRTVLNFKVSGSSFSRMDMETELVESLENLSLGDLLYTIRLFLKSYKDLAGNADELPMLVASLEAASKFTGNTTDLPKKKVKIEERAEKVKEFEKLVLSEPVKMVVATPSPQEEVLSISLEEVKSAWPAVYDSLKTLNRPLATLVKSFPLLRVHENQVVVGVKFLFHKENMESAKNQAVLSEALKIATGQNLRLIAEVLPKDTKLEPDDGGASVGDVLAVFGGELVE